VFLYGRWYVQLIGVSSYGSDNTVGSVVLIFQLSTWACSPPVPAVHPYQVTGLEDWCRSCVGICPLCLSWLGVLHLGLGYFMNKFQLFRCGLCLPLFRSIHSKVQHDAVPGM